MSQVIANGTTTSGLTVQTNVTSNPRALMREREVTVSFRIDVSDQLPAFPDGVVEVRIQPEVMRQILAALSNT